MKSLIKYVLLLCLSLHAISSDAQGYVMIANYDYSCPDPRNENSTWEIHKGDALHVYARENSYDYFGPYTAACVSLPKDLLRLPGSVRGEKCIVVNGTKVNLREGPSTKTGIYCLNILYSGSVSQDEFRSKPGKEYGEDGYVAEWLPFFFNKGTRLPYLGKYGNFYKSKFNNVEFYISSKFSYIR